MALADVGGEGRAILRFLPNSPVGADCREPLERGLWRDEAAEGPVIAGIECGDERTDELDLCGWRAALRGGLQRRSARAISSGGGWAPSCQSQMVTYNPWSRRRLRGSSVNIVPGSIGSRALQVQPQTTVQVVVSAIEKVESLSTVPSARTRP
jgi:hypothetical protein